MAKQQQPVSGNRTIPAAVHDFLSENGKKGGMTTAQLIEMGKKYARENNIDIGEDFDAAVEEESGRGWSRRDQ